MLNRIAIARAKIDNAVFKFIFKKYFCSCQDILKDRSDKKKDSHSRLVAFIHQHEGTSPLTRVSLKSQLISLCQAYGVKSKSQSSKLVLAQDLLNAISRHSYIPNTRPVDDHSRNTTPEDGSISDTSQKPLDERQFRVVESLESDGHIRLRLRRGIWCM